MPTPYARPSQEAPPARIAADGGPLRSIRRVTAFLAVTLLLLGTLGLAQEGVLRVATEPPVQLDPAFASTDAEVAVLNAVYDYLVDVDADNEIRPRLAVDWTVSEDGLRYVFALVDDAVFHDGSPLRARDVVWTFDRLRDPELDLPTSDLYATIASVEATGEHEVTFTLREPNPFFLYDLSDNHAVVLKEGAEEPGTTFNGTGPFRVESYRAGTRMSLAANEAYFAEGKPGVATLEFIFFPDQVAAVDALRGGQVDLVLRMPTPLHASLEGLPGIRTLAVPTNGFDLIRLRADRPPGDDPRVQEALKLATDREAILEAVTLGLGAPGKHSPIGPLYERWHAEGLDVPEPDVERARELLAEAGHPDGLELELHVPDTGDRPTLAAVLEEQWGRAGIDVEIVVQPESVYYGENGWLEVDLGITGWGSRPVPQFYLDVMIACEAQWNEAHWCDEEVDGLIETAGTTRDEAEREAAYLEIQRILLERGPFLVPYFFPQLGAIAEGFEGFELKAFAGRSDLAAVHSR